MYVRVHDLGPAYPTIRAVVITKKTAVANDEYTKFKKLKKGTKLVLDYKAFIWDDDSTISLNDYNPDSHSDGIIEYHIKGTKWWIESWSIKIKKDLPENNWMSKKLRSILWQQLLPIKLGAKLYDKNGKVRYFSNGEPVSFQRAQSGFIYDLRYIWVPSEKKVELFYNIGNDKPIIEEKNITWVDNGNNFVRAKDSENLLLTPSNTPQEAIKIAKKQGLYNGK